MNIYALKSKVLLRSSLIDTVYLFCFSILFIPIRNFTHDSFRLQATPGRGKISIIYAKIKFLFMYYTLKK